MTIREALSLLRKELSVPLGCFAQPQSEEILQFIFNCSRSELFLSSDRSLTEFQKDQLSLILKRRLNGEPLAYILGKTFFYSREFIVTRSTLIPRPDTEVLVEQVLLNEKQDKACFVDIGIGSGIISTVLTEERPQWRALGIDISFDTLKVAKQNITKAVQLLCSDLLSALKSSKFDFLVSNPPYISGDEMNVLDPEVKDYEPHLALYGGNDGLYFYRKLAFDAGNVLKKNGRLYCEIGYNQQDSVMEVFRDAGVWEDLNITRDLSGHPRVLRAVLRKDRLKQ